ncbi:MAG: hypothetical protein A3I89_03435 [Candidatus Harrisonbacteria bacterium RIFCSPLOWO2_02_FULL_41_11]|uniref:Zinc finger DksA/TraR C4-type domain-containing protein n=1 Tax=Candidatus Harrisonbacteria bacterium RIFCSPHIGHO2_02_FULL_42_16 TaxID=1798404 RepID=A0A1G1ZHE6_9BACT|nr:MAG: hypothetical protein A3B92_04200 [Candidatus Harrisonbacteria bacterium RIFCSPHIGHO2_02_FULL_42_16]OGY65504.1 MAG: hypothetical protein A3I89_03435 [Candidatus Harrisonbacteria bacterium RIFCSPLOWO2_02_FULL_41_11]
MSHLSEKELQNLKEQLEKEAGEIESRAEVNKRSPEFGSDTETDFSEEADEAEEQSNQLGVQQALKERLADIELALDKMTRGEYGKCEKCGMDIEIEVLQINPESRLCKACKAV